MIPIVTDVLYFLAFPNNKNRGFSLETAELYLSGTALECSSRGLYFKSGDCLSFAEKQRFPLHIPSKTESILFISFRIKLFRAQHRDHSSVVGHSIANEEVFG